MRYVWVGLAGALGATARYGIGVHADQSRFPWATLAINLTGALALALLLTLGAAHLPEALVVPLGAGLLGGFTTFSTFAWEGLTLGRDGRALVAVLYVGASVLGGLAAAGLGYVLGRALR